MPYNKIVLLVIGLLLSNCKTDKQATTTCMPMQEAVEASLLEFDRQKGITKFKGNPFCGTAIIRQDSILIASTEYRIGKKQGSTKKWFANGQLSYEAYYQHGKKDSIARTWWKDGTPRTVSKFKKGVAHGLQLSWYRSGAKFKAINLVDGREEGLQKAWRENGKIYNNYEAKNGRIFGLKRAALCYELEEEKI